MGIGEWFGWGKREPEPIIEVPAPPTSDTLLRALDSVETMARAGKVPPMVMARLTRVSNVVRQTVPRLDNLGGGSSSAYSVMATATDYLPGAIGGYLRLPRDWADSRPVDRGKTSLLILIDQLDLLGATMDQIFDAVCRADAEALVVHGRFLQQKFGVPSGGGGLGIDPGTALPPMPPTVSFDGSVSLPAPSLRSGPVAAPTAGPAGPAWAPGPWAPPTGTPTHSNPWPRSDDPDTGDLPLSHPPAETGRLAPPAGREA